MKRWSSAAGIALAFLVATHAPEMRERAQLKREFRSDPSKEATLLSTAWCGYCKKARAFLERNGVSFVEIDVEREIRGQNLYQTFGSPGVPILVVDDEPIFGMNVDGWIRALEAERS